MEAIQDNRNKGNKLKELYVKLRGIKNIEIAIAIIALALVLIIYAAVSGTSDKKKENTLNNNSNGDALAVQLETILGEITGAGRVKVMITYDGTVEYVTANTTNTNSNTTIDTNRTSTNTSTIVSPVIVNNNGSSGPIILKEIHPDIKGVVVVAEGANNLIVRLELMRAVMVALNIGAQNIEIFPMK